MLVANLEAGVRVTDYLAAGWLIRPKFQKENGEDIC